MKTNKQMIILNTGNFTDKEIETFLLCVSEFKDLKTDLTPFEVERTRVRKPLLITTFDQKLKSTNLYSFEELTELCKEGFGLNSVKDFRGYLNLLNNEFRYY